jgi:CheY-like chemotaxis protein
MKAYCKTIVCVDDDPDDLMLLRQAIEVIDSERQVLEARDGIDALQLLYQMKGRSELPCLIVLDINMPRLDGKQTLVAIQKDQALSSIPVVLFSTSNSPLDKTFCEAKHVELLTKPFDFKTLYLTANKLLSYCAA